MKRFFSAPFLVMSMAAVICISSLNVALSDTFGSGANTFDIEFVTIGNPGNAADTTGNPNPAGKVDYAYRMGRFEISEKMIVKANTLGGLGITKDTRGPDKPATTVNWNEAARFINWLNTSSGSTPAYKFAIQPGEVGYNANANIDLWTIGDAGYNAANLYRNSLARYFLPSAHEWYKAAYYDPTSGVYYNYPTGSDSVPDGIDFAGDPDFDAVFFDGGINPQPNDITNVGLLSPYGTAGQGGNVFEWEETDRDLVNDSSSSDRGIRGGSWDVYFSDLLLSSNRIISNFPSDEGRLLGFRVASSAEPGDFDLDNDVDGADFLKWQRGESPNAGSASDLDQWQAGFGAFPLQSTTSTTVPEPSTATLLIIMAVGRRCRRQRTAPRVSITH